MKLLSGAIYALCGPYWIWVANHGTNNDRWWGCIFLGVILLIDGIKEMIGGLNK